MTVPTDIDALRRRVNEMKWHHRIDLGHGIVSPGGDISAEKLKGLHFPSMTGKTVLDIGAWDGFFSFEAERLGASRVLALDSFAWGGPQGADWGSQEPFNLAREVLGSKVEDVYCDVFDISPERLGRFDIVLFMGVMYHMKDPFGSMEHAASVCDELMIVEGMTDMNLTRRPAAAFYEGSSMFFDNTNWWGPNLPAVKAMLRELGFTRIEYHQAPLIDRVRRVAARTRDFAKAKASGKAPNESWASCITGRFVVHAYR